MVDERVELVVREIDDKMQRLLDDIYANKRAVDSNLFPQISFLSKCYQNANTWKEF